MLRPKHHPEGLEAAIMRGDIGWNAKALNLMPELADRELYAYSLQVSKKLNARFNTSWGSSLGKSADVAGVSRAVVPIMADAGLKALHIGFNAACVTPDVPSVLRWQDRHSNTEILLMIADSYGEEVAFPGTDGITVRAR